MDELLSWRKEFPILESAVHMISHSLGAMPRRASESMQEYAQTWSTRGIRAWEEGWWEMPRTAAILAPTSGIRSSGTFQTPMPLAEKPALRW